jgi:Uma2 family endonuclease
VAQPPFPRTRPLPELRYIRAPQPIVFPEEAEVPEGLRHLALRTCLWRVLQLALGPLHSVGSDQLVYWNARDARRALSPDVFVKLDVPQSSFGSWQTWRNGGTPELAVEIISPNEGDGIAWDEKLARYHELGVKELVRFDPEASVGQRLRAWDRVREDLVERQLEGERTPCLTLGLNWAVGAAGGEPVGLRLVDDTGRVLPTPEEAEARARAEAEARAGAAEERVRELEEALRRMQGRGE